MKIGFQGRGRVYATLEYRFLVGPDSQIFVFTDLGAVTLIKTPSVLTDSEWLWRWCAAGI